MGGDMTRELGQLWLHLHDASVSALAAAVITLGVVLMMELRSVMRLRQVMDNHLARVFEQLDLLRFETQQLLEGQQALPAAGASSAVAPGSESASAAPTLQPNPDRLASPLMPQIASGALYRNAAAMAATGASSREIAERLGLASGEARLLSSLAQARARREQAVSA
jgi:hypothetical protein